MSSITNLSSHADKFPLFNLYYDLSSQLFIYGIHPTSESLINNTPALDTVAGVALFKFEISKISLIDGVKKIRSLLTKVKTLLSSITVFNDSIHSGSISPSKIVHL